jgi:hypothetical protein
MKSTTSSKKKPYVRMTRKELVNRLTARGLPPHYVGAIADRVEERKIAARVDSRAKARHREAWQIVIEPLIKEQRSVAARLTRMRKNNDTEQLAVYEPYASALSKCLGLLRTYKRGGTRLPQEEYAFRNNVSDKNKAGHDVPLGESWVDWVPAHIQTAMKQAHAKLQKPNTRILVRLFRRDEDIRRGFIQQHAKVKTVWQDELNKLRDVIDHAPEGTREFERRQAALIEIAMEKANAVRPTRRLHQSWNRYVTAKEREQVYREAHPSWRSRVSALAADETPVDWDM